MNSTAAREFSLPIRVYIEDTDAGGIVYYVNYLKYFERARTEFMRELGYGKPAFPLDGLMFVVSEAHIGYRNSARLDDHLVATATVTRVGAASLTFAQKIYRDDVCLVEGEVVIALVTREGARPKRLPVELRERVALWA